MQDGGTDIPSEIYEVTDLNIKTTGKNLFDGLLESGGFDDYGNPILTTTKMRSVNYMWVAPNVYYALSYEYSKSIKFDIYFYDENKIFIEKTTWVANKLIPINCKFIRFATREIVDDSIKIMFELSKTATSYQPYQESSITHHLAKPLRATKDGSVRDVIDVVNMQTTYNMKDVLLDGTQNINAENNNIYNIVMSDINYIGGTATAFCEKYIGVSYQKRNDYDTCICAAIGKLLIRNTKTNSNKELKEELTQNPITVLYATSQPITELLEDELVKKLKTLKTFSLVTHVSVTGIAKPKLNAKYPKDIALAQQQLEAKVITLQEAVIKNV